MFNIKSIKQTFYQVVKFCIVGSFAVFLNYSIFIISLVYFNIHYLISGLIGYLSTTVPIFLLNRYWTFRSSVSIYKGYGVFIIINIITMSSHVTIQFLSKEYLGVPEVYSQACGIVVSVLISFLLVRKLMKSKI